MNADTPTSTSFPSPLISPAEREFLPPSWTFETWDDLSPYFQLLLDRDLSSKEDLENWLKHWSELERVMAEEGAWRQIRLTRDTTNEEYRKAYENFVQEIDPRVKPLVFELNKKLTSSPFLKDLDKELYFPFLRSVQNQISLFREENVPIQAELDLKAQEFGQIMGERVIEWEGQQYTLQQAARFLEEPDRSRREKVFYLIQDSRAEVSEKLDRLFDDLLIRRHQIAQNAGYENYRDYKFAELGRFDYGPEDCFRFHEAIRDHIVPLHRLILERRQQRLGLDRLRPWDTSAEPAHRPPLKPFSSGRELIDKSIAVFDRLDPFFGECIRTMDHMGRLDLESRRGKAPGGYNCPLADTGVPFIFMNAVGTLSDLITMMHEGGHAFHSFLAHDLALNGFKEYPMEMAELASMSMELFTMEHWDLFFENPEDHRRAQAEELERVISVLPWIATIDAFQHWLYTHPGHSWEQRDQAWMDILNTYSTGQVDWEGLEAYQRKGWQRQLHLFEVPFYYIEYGVAQVGAMAMWRQYRKNPQQALENYKKALSLGYTRPLPQLYAQAGIAFDFSAPYVQELSSFILEEMEKRHSS